MIGCQTMLTRNTSVLHPVHNAFWTGVVIGQVRKLDGEELTVCERPDGAVFMCHESSLLVVDQPSKIILESV